jgi:hypothetical protein
MKLRVNLSIDVTKIDKDRIKMGKKRPDGSYGKYIDLTTYLDTDKDSQYGDHGFISQQVSQEEREAGTQTPILGNCKVVWSDIEEEAVEPSRPVKQQELMDDDIPF